MSGDLDDIPKMPDRALWISWERHRRSQSLAARLNVPLFEFQSTTPRWLKHPLFALRTLILLARERPRLLFVQNPSAFLTLLAIFFKRFFRYLLIVDAHNAGVYPFEKGHEKYSKIFPFMHRHADLTIVTNHLLAEIVEGNGGTVAVLPDPLPDFGPLPPVTPGKNDCFIVTYICSFSSDEPYLEVFKAGGQLPDNIRIYVTGNHARLHQEELELAKKNNIILTGYLSEKEYIQQLCNSDCIMVLTEFDDCMVCGAYEAVALAKPLILSDTPVLRWWFKNGTIFTGNVNNDIISSIKSMREHYGHVLFLVKKTRSYLHGRWHVKYVILRKVLFHIINGT